MALGAEVEYISHVQEWGIVVKGCPCVKESVVAIGFHPSVGSPMLNIFFPNTFSTSFMYVPIYCYRIFEQEMGHLHAGLCPPFAKIAVVLTAGPPTPKPCAVRGSHLTYIQGFHPNKISEALDLDSSHKPPTVKLTTGPFPAVSVNS